MKDLRKYYISRMVTLSSVIVSLSVYVAVWLIPNVATSYGETSFLVKFLKILVSRPVVVMLLTVLHFIINNWLWTIKIIGKPELDFRGVWEGKTTYNTIYFDENNRSLPFSKDHIVKIKQSCLNIELTPTKGDAFVNWGSLAVNLSDEHTIQYAYWVNYTDTTLFPPKAKGYEELKAIDYEKKKPTELSGEFYHCAEGLKPIYTGFVNFKRKTYKN